MENKYKCPDCGSCIIWTLSNSREGSRSETYCGNNVQASRIDFNPKSAIFCNWSGIAIRQKDGSVRLFYKDGITAIRPSLQKSKV